VRRLTNLGTCQELTAETPNLRAGLDQIILGYLVWQMLLTGCLTGFSHGYLSSRRICMRQSLRILKTRLSILWTTLPKLMTVHRPPSGIYPPP
jgi:hypothetical protein